MHVTESPWISMQVGRDTLPLSLSDDGRTVEEVRRLDPHAVGAIYDRYFIDVYRYVRYRINDDGIAEDVASDVFVRLLEALRKAQGPQSNVRGWLLATASNAVNDHLRRQYRRPLAQLTDNMQADANVSVEVDEREQNRAVKRAYTQLTAEQQHVLALRFGLGYSLEETAEQLKKKVNAVKALQFRALASLQRMMRGSSHE